jgi:hypothetical protein
MADIDNLKIQQQINKLIDDRQAQLTSISKEIGNQVQLSVQLSNALSNIKFDSLFSSLKDGKKAMEEAAKQAKTLESSVTESVKGAISSHSTGLGELSKSYTTLGGVGAGAWKALSVGGHNVMGVLKSVTGTAWSLVTALGRVGFAILSIPFRMIGAFFKSASEFTGDVSFMQAIENVRKSFGNLREDVGKDVMQTFRNLRGEIANTGLSAYRVLGLPAERLNFVRELFEGLGAQAHKFGLEIVKNSGELVALSKGLGIAEKDLKGVANRASAFGIAITEQERLIANFSLQMGRAFGMSQKLISKDMNEMIKDVAHFGSLSQKEMAVTTVYTRKLGVEVKDLLGFIDKFDTFEDAANAASQLNQAFGASIDAFRIMDEQNPAKRLDMIRDAMFAAGKSGENLSRVETKLVAQITNMDASIVQNALSSKNAGVAYTKVASEAEKAQAAQLSMAQATKQLSASIERIVHDGNMLKGTFFDTFIHGMRLGVLNSGPFLRAIMATRMEMWRTLNAGREVGMMFVNTFPGIKDMLEGITKVFRQGKFTSFLHDIVASFRNFFNDLKNGSYSPAKLIESFQKNFFNFFNKATPEGNQILNGFKDFLKTYAGLFGNFVKWGIEALTKGINQLADFIKSPTAFINALKGGGRTKSMAMEIIKPLLDAFSDPSTLKNFGSALWKLFESISAKLSEIVQSPKFQAVIGPVVKGLAISMFGPMAMKIFSASLVGLFQGTFAVGGGLAKLVTGTISKFTDKVGGVTTGGKFTGIKSVLAGAAGMLAGLATMAAGVGLLRLAFKGMSKDDIENFVMGVSAMGKVMFQLGLVIPIMTGVGAAIALTGGAGWAALGIGMVTFAGVLTGMSAAIYGIVTELRKMSFSPTDAVSLQAFSGALLSVSEFAKSISSAIQVIPNVMSASEGDKISENFGLLNKFIENMMGDNGIKGIIQKLTESSKVLAAEGMKQGVVALVSSISSVTELVKAMTPAIEDDSVLERFASLVTLGTGSNDKYKKISTFMADIINNLTNDKVGLFPKLKDLIVRLQEANITDIGIKGVDTFAKLTGVIGPLMQTMIPAISMLATLGSKKIKDADGKEITEFNDAGMVRMAALFSSAQASISMLVDTVATSTLPKLINIVSGLKIESLNRVSKIVPFITSVASLLQTLSAPELSRMVQGAGGATGIANGAVITMSKRAPELAVLLESLAGGIKTTIDKIISATDAIKDPGVLGPKIAIISKAFEMLGTAANSLKSFDNFGENTKNFSARIHDTIIPNLNSTLSATADVVASINNINEALAKGDAGMIAADVKLRNYAGSPNLRAKQTYTITNNGITINATINVTMTASDVEEAVLYRQNSVIRENLNARPPVPTNQKFNNIPPHKPSPTIGPAR